jgi:hypothetical protein
VASVADRAVEIAVSYMGPAGRKFLERQTSAHMSGLPLDKLETRHLGDLAKWIEVSAGLLMDAKKASEFAGKIRTLG